MNDPEQAGPADTGHERPGGYDEDPRQDNAGAHGIQGAHAAPEDVPGGPYPADAGPPGAQPGPYQGAYQGGAQPGSYQEVHQGPPPQGAHQGGPQPGSYQEVHQGPPPQGGPQPGASQQGAYEGQAPQQGTYQGPPQQDVSQGSHPGAAQPGPHPGAPPQGPGTGDQQPGAYPGPPDDRGREAPGEPSGGAGEDTGGTMIDPERAARWRAQWEDVRAMFVDQPQDAVARADGLVGEVLDELSRTFTEQRSALDPATLGGDPSTEELRRAVQRYREFFDRLLTL